jgi:hypothetical protein
MSSTCFISQVATADLLMRVTNMCAECYSDLKEGDTIHYDMQSYRYLCESCQEKLCEKLNNNCEIIEDETQGLF